MKNSGVFTEKWNQFKENRKAKEPVTVENMPPEEEEKGGNKFTRALSLIGRVLFRLRKVVMAAPVVYFALKLAAYNSENLPLLVGINLQTTGEFAQTISRQNAVTGPLIVTGACLVLMFCSRKAVYPWLISIFSLVLPLLLLVTNLYPA